MTASLVASLLAVKANTRLALATALVERNAEVLALRAERSMPAPQVTAPVAEPDYVTHERGEQEDKAARRLVRPTITCRKCNGSGLWYGAGRIENGVFVGATGTCFACQGKQVETDADQRRNWGHAKNNSTSYLTTVAPAAPAARVPSGKVVDVPVSAELSFKERCAIAKAAAMAGGKCVRMVAGVAA